MSGEINGIDGDEAVPPSLLHGTLSCPATGQQLEFIDEEQPYAWSTTDQPFVIQAQYVKSPPHRSLSVASIYDSGPGEDQGSLTPAGDPDLLDRQLPTPLPMIPLFVLTVVIFSEPLTSTILFPFIYFMFCTSIFWGYMSDKYGRRPILLLGLIGSTITCNVGVAKSMLGEIADESNQGQAFSLFGFAWGIGMIVGPILGSRLSNPAQNFPAIFGNWQFFIDYPYFLPCLVASLGSFLGFLVGLFFLKETKTWPEQEERERLEALEKEKERRSGYAAYDEQVLDDSIDQHDQHMGSGNGLPKNLQHGGNDPVALTMNNSESNLREVEINSSGEDEDLHSQEQQPLLEPSSGPQVRFTNGQGSALATGSRQHYGSMSSLSLGLNSSQGRGFDPTNEPTGTANVLEAAPSSPPVGRSSSTMIYQRPFQSVSAATGRTRRGGYPGRQRPSLNHASSQFSVASSVIQVDPYDRPWASTSPRAGHVPTSFSSSYMPSLSSIYHRPSSYIPTDARSIGVNSTGYSISASRYGGSSIENADWIHPTQRPTTPVLLIPANDRITQQRLSATTSQIFVLPPDPDNKDPNQPVQLLVVPSNNTGLSPLSITSIIAYSTLALHSIVFEEAYTLFAVTPLVSHGLGWTANLLGSSLASMGLVQLTLQFVVYPRLERRLSAVFLFRLSQLLYVVVYMWFPLVRYFLVDESQPETGGQTRLVWNMVLMGLVLKYFCSVCSYTAVMVMV
ncbi:hypothetical protein DFQ27_007922 [Actinomortierella ambigua]|uniref:Major facilitator superfamily (MFS) profile domain-containing protein n=1 Tax=Actinomortierella ambigua TaxID=1343610 RepID=A0A9P6TZ10_9FUNG|nr:hypothetical protein DFQ27_007922 [Actinomortierella ambigua]